MSDAHPELALHALVEQQVRRTPEAVALICADERMTYRELDARATRLARWLRRRGVRPDVLVGLSLERSPELVVALLAVLKAGGAYLPMDPAYPAERVSFMVADAGARLVLTRAMVAEALTGPDDAIDDDSAAPAGSDDLAYVIYTSGSTGRPKGVMIEHRAIVNHVRWITGTIWQRRPQTFLQITSAGFDAAGWEFWAPLTTGGTLVVAPAELRVDARSIERVVTGHAVTVIGFTPSVLRELLNDGFTAPTVRWVLCGGEALTGELISRCRAQLPATAVYNLYGPTETCINSTALAVGGELPDGPVPIGREIANTRLVVVAETGRPAAPGEPGELLVGGAGVARGYRNRPSLTAERFVPDTYGGPPGARLYRTGDLVLERPDGNLEFLGRADHQIKIRGFRIEPGEIEAALARQEGVRGCVVTVREDHPGDRRLVGYLAGDRNRISVDAVREQLKRILPAHMVPAAMVVLDALPVTPNGKIDRAALPAPDQLREQLGTAFAAPRTALEQAFAEAWAEVLRLPAEQVGVHDNFFDLGGDSLLATRVQAIARATVCPDLDLATLFTHPTVAELAAWVERRPGAPGTTGIPRATRDGIIPLSSAQEGLWYFEQLRPGTAVYHVPIVFRLIGEVDEAALKAALDQVVTRHEVLRTTFAAVNGRAGQVVADRVEVPFEIRRAAPGGGFANALALAREAAAVPFDLTTGPLIRAQLIRLHPSDAVLAVVAHHIVFDGWSIGVFLRELTRSYAGDPLEQLPIQYADYAVWQRDRLASGDLDPQLAYWRQRLSGRTELLTLPAARPRPPVRSLRGARERVEVPASLTAAVHTLARAEGVTVYMVLLAAFKALLARHSGMTDIVVGTPVAGRSWAQTAPLIGDFVNTVVLRTDLSGEPSVRDLLGRVRETAVAAYAHQELPLERLVEELQPRRDLGHTPLFQVMFVLQNAPTTAVELPGLVVKPHRPDDGAARFDLTLDLQVVGDTIRGMIEYSTDLFGPEAVRELASDYLALLETMTADPTAPAVRFVVPAAASPGDGTSPATAGEPVAEEPGGAVEELLAHLWSQVLGVPADDIHPHDNFFEIGGHSLLAMQLLNHINTAFGSELDLRTLYWGATMSELAEALRAAGEPGYLEDRARVVLQIERMTDAEVAAELG
ncbi:non-ribosomal peptide synthetase [Micromonospora coerulea]|uniref:non-ribosomal peptide synthetase n=1 Tax=Micromonospora coerulea TaxID=47856 RepID=UPI00190876BF|nr:non-ribosomal peptide synthetase [Micromonospora veneta]